MPPLSMLIKTMAIWNTVRTAMVLRKRGERVKEDKVETLELRGSSIKAQLRRYLIQTRDRAPLRFFEIPISTRTRLSLPESGSRVDFAGRLIFREHRSPGEEKCATVGR